MFRAFEQLFVIALFLSYMGVVDALTRPPTAQRGLMILADKAPLATVIIQIGVYLWGFVLVSMRWRRVLSTVRNVWPLLVFVALAPLSTLWSVRPLLTLQRSMNLLVSTVLAIYLGERYSIEELARLLVQALCLMIVAVIVLHVVAPAYVMDVRFADSDAGHRGGWRGLTEHKNLFGEYMAVAIALVLLVRFRPLRWLRYAYLVTAALLLVLSRSANAVACAVLIVASMPLWRLRRLDTQRRWLAYIMLGLGVCVGVCLLWGDTRMVLDLLGRDSTLTGRTQVWAMVIPAILKHPFLGYGYGAFWDAFKGETLDVWLGLGFLARGAHNDYLDLCLSFGFLGVPFFLYMFFYYFRLAIRYANSDASRIAVWPVTYLCFFALHNFTESGLIQSWRSLPFLLFAIVVTSLAVNRRRQEFAILHRIRSARGISTATARAGLREVVP